MSRHRKAIGVFLVAMFGLWGCARGPSATTNANNDKIKALEVKGAKLEEDLKSTLAAKDQLRKKLGDAEDAQAQMQKQIDRLLVVEKERNELLAQLKTRTSERDLVQSKYEGFLKDIRELAGKAEATLPTFKSADTGVASGTTGESTGPTLPIASGS